MLNDSQHAFPFLAEGKWCHSFRLELDEKPLEIQKSSLKTVKNS